MEVCRDFTYRLETQEAPESSWHISRPAGKDQLSGKDGFDFHCFSFYSAFPRALSFPGFGVAIFLIGFPQKPTSDIQLLLLGCSAMTSGKGEGDDPRVHMAVTPVRYLSLVPGGMPGSSSMSQSSALWATLSLDPGKKIPSLWEESRPSPCIGNPCTNPCLQRHTSHTSPSLPP